MRRGSAATAAIRASIGRRLELNGRPYQVVGVLPASFSLPHEVLPTLGNAADADIVIPLPLGPTAAQTRNREDYNIIGRLKPGASLVQAQREMDTLTARLRRDFPDFYPPNGGLTFGVVPLQEQVVGGVRRSLAILVGAVACVLLIACANVANLLLSRGVSRRKELAVRAALGASRARIVRQLLTESVLLGLAGGAVGLLFAFWALGWMQALGSKSVPRLHEIRINGGVLLFTIALSILSAILFGLAPAMRAAASLDLQTELKDGHGASAGLAPVGRRQRTRQLLVIAELTLVRHAAGRGGPADSQLRAAPARPDRLQRGSRADDGHHAERPQVPRHGEGPGRLSRLVDPPRAGPGA